MKSFEVLQTFGTDFYQVHSVFSCPFPLADRDTVCLRIYETLPDGRGLGILQSVNDPSVALGSGRVRAALTGGFLLTPESDPQQTHVIRYIHFDVKGAVPSFVLNSQISAWAKSLPSLAEAATRVHKTRAAKSGL